MIKMMILSRRRPGMTHAEFLSFNVDRHGPSVRRHPVTITHYMQHDVYDGAFGCTGDAEHAAVFGRDNLTELYFETRETMDVFLNDPEMRQGALNDGVNYVDLATPVVMYAEDTEFPVAQDGGGRLKVFHFLKGRDGTPIQNFRARWQEAFEQALAKSGTEEHLRKAILSEPAADSDGSPKDESAPQTSIDSAMTAQASFYGYSTFWYDSEGTGAGYFRAYVDAFIELTRDWLDASGSFFLLAREQLIFDHR